jgi:zinc transport system permease protein
VLLAVMFYGGIAGGVVLIGLSPSGTPANLTSYLFGAITTTTASDLVVFGLLGGAVLLVVGTLAPRLFVATNDEEYARAVGVPVTALHTLLAVLTAATVVVSMRVVGLLLITALMIVPNAVGQVTASSFRACLLVAVAVGVSVSVSGTAASFYLDTPSGATIVLLAIGVFLAAVAASAARAAVHARRRHHAAVHRHEHAPGCGHEALVHGDHVDYVHDGHRHAAHGAVYDEH